MKGQEDRITDAELLEYMNRWEPLYEKGFVIKESQIRISQEKLGFGLRPSKEVRSALGL